METEIAGPIEYREIKTKEGYLEFHFVAHCHNDKMLLQSAKEMFQALKACKPLMETGNPEKDKVWGMVYDAIHNAEGIN